jgi:hypothetical protein
MSEPRENETANVQPDMDAVFDAVASRRVPSEPRTAAGHVGTPPLPAHAHLTICTADCSLPDHNCAEAAEPYIAQIAALVEALRRLHGFTVLAMSAKASDIGKSIDLASVGDAEAVLANLPAAAEQYTEDTARRAVGAATGRNCRLIRVNEELFEMSVLARRDARSGYLITGKWGEPDKFGVYEPIFTATDDGWLAEQRRAAVESLTERVEAEWYNGNLSADAYERILRGLLATDAEDHTPPKENE